MRGVGILRITQADGARQLAEGLVHISAQSGLPATALLTDMSQPLARSAGNALEVLEAVRMLRGEAADPRLVEVTLALGAELLKLGGIASDEGAAQAILRKSLDSGDAAERFARMADDPGAESADNTALFAGVLAEHARAHLGTSRAAVDTIASWPSGASEPALGRELTYWAARTLLLRRSPGLALKVSESAWAAPPARGNVELRWRLAVLAAQASLSVPVAGEGAIMRASARDDLRTLLEQWSGPGDTYIARPDLAALRKDLAL